MTRSAPLPCGCSAPPCSCEYSDDGSVDHHSPPPSSSSSAIRPEFLHPSSSALSTPFNSIPSSAPGLPLYPSFQPSFGYHATQVYPYPPAFFSSSQSFQSSPFIQAEHAGDTSARPPLASSTSNGTLGKRKRATGNSTAPRKRHAVGDTGMSD